MQKNLKIFSNSDPPAYFTVADFFIFWFSTSNNSRKAFCCQCLNDYQLLGALLLSCFVEVLLFRPFFNNRMRSFEIQGTYPFLFYSAANDMWMCWPFLKLDTRSSKGERNEFKFLVVTNQRIFLVFIPNQDNASQEISRFIEIKFRTFYFGEDFKLIRLGLSVVRAELSPWFFL